MAQWLFHNQLLARRCWSLAVFGERQAYTGRVEIIIEPAVHLSDG